MNKAVFLDRDGVINRENGDYIFRQEDFVFTEGLFETLKEISRKGYLIIVVSNQGGIDKGMYKKEDTEKLHDRFLKEARKHGVAITEIYYCTHHPGHGSKCICRKPDSVLVEKALARFQIDASKSYFVGDKERDILAGQKAGVTGILVEENRPLGEIIQKIL